MSEENVEIVLGWYKAFTRGDIEFILDRVNEDVSWHPANAQLLGMGAMHGKERLRTYFTRDMAEAFTGFTTEAVQVEDLGENGVLVQSRYEGAGRVSGAPVRLDTFSLFRFREGKIACFSDYDTRAEALEAAGLSE